MSKHYMLEMSVTGTYAVEVDAESLEEAMEKADALYQAADFGVLEDPDCEYTWYAAGNGERILD